MKTSDCRPAIRVCAFGAAAALLLLAVPASASAHTQRGTATPAAGLQPLTPLKGEVDHGAARPSADQVITLVLAPRNQTLLTQLSQAQVTPGNADFHRWLTPAEFTAQFGPSTQTVQAATDFAQAHGLTVQSISTNRTLVRLAGTTAQINAAFGVIEQSITAGGQTFLTPDRTGSLPASLTGLTTAVLGLTTYNPATHPMRTTTAAASQTVGTASYGPRDFWAIYHAPIAGTGEGQRVGIITSGDISAVGPDLATFQHKYKLPATPLSIVQNGPTSTDASEVSEYDLDSQYSTGFAPGVTGVVAYNSATLGDIGPLNDFANDPSVPTASASYGGCEILNALLGNLAADDQAFKQMSVEGKSMFVSSGDEGSGCAVAVNTGTPVGIPDVEYPSSSPYVVSVGGTTLTGQAAQPLREITWIGGGGGYSNVEAAPAWQTSSIEFQAALGLRGLPDVSLDADPLSGYTVIVNGVATNIGGTSASAPAWNGIWARVLQAHPKAGFAAPALYAAHAALTDITVGTNGFYAATAGYDLSTGLGSADITRLIAAIK